MRPFKFVNRWLGKKTVSLKPRLGSEFTRKDVRRVSLRLDKENKPIRLGGGFHDVYLGNLVFNNGVRKRVTIKRFNKGIEQLKIDDVTARKYQKVINALRLVELEHDATFPKRQLGKAKMLPKMGMVKADLGSGPEWVLVSQAFVKGNKSKFENVTVKYKSNPKEFTWLLLRLGEKGFINSKHMSMVTDVFSHHLESSFIPLDIDFANVIDVNRRKTKPEVANDILSGLKEHINLTKATEKPNFKNKEYLKLFNELIKHEMHPDLKKLLLENKEKFLE